MPFSSAWVSKPPRRHRVHPGRHAGPDAAGHHGQLPAERPWPPAEPPGRWPSLVVLLVARPRSAPAERLGRGQQVGEARAPPAPAPAARRVRPAQRGQPRAERAGRRLEAGQRQRGPGRLLADRQRRQRRLDGDRAQRVPAGRVQPAAQPAGGAGPVRRAGLPDVHRPEVAAVRLRVADAPDDRQPLAVPQRLAALHRRVQAEPVAQRRAPRPRSYASSGAGVVVRRVGVRDDGVEPVVAAVQGDQDERRGVPAAGRSPAGRPAPASRACRRRRPARRPPATPVATRKRRRVSVSIVGLLSVDARTRGWPGASASSRGGSAAASVSAARGAGGPAVHGRAAGPAASGRSAAVGAGDGVQVGRAGQRPGRAAAGPGRPRWTARPPRPASRRRSAAGTAPGRARSARRAAARAAFRRVAGRRRPSGRNAPATPLDRLLRPAPAGSRGERRVGEQRPQQRGDVAARPVRGDQPVPACRRGGRRSAVPAPQPGGDERGRCRPAGQQVDEPAVVDSPVTPRTVLAPSSCRRGDQLAVPAARSTRQPVSARAGLLHVVLGVVCRRRG